MGKGERNFRTHEREKPGTHRKDLERLHEKLAIDSRIGRKIVYPPSSAPDRK